MDTSRICKQCGQPLAPDAPEGLCPTCVAKVALGSEPANPGPRVPPDVAQVAAQFPQLEILELLGVGGMGMVYKARQPRLDRIVALKILPVNSTSEPFFAERFNREAKALAKLNHPDIVGIYDFGQTDQYYYFVMEYVDGMNLRRLLDAHTVIPRQALEIVVQICTALQYAHDQGVVHRDIKPENILLDKKGQVKIADFGLAKLLGNMPDTALTLSQAAMGTMNYMAPEQRENAQRVDHRADIYSLGVVFYEMLTGEVPMGRFEPPSKKVQMDVRLDEVVLRALEREPARRYQRVSEVKTNVETINSTTNSTTPSAPPAAHAPPVALPYVGPQSTSGMALASLICGLLICLQPITGILANIFGIIGLVKTKDPRVGGRGMCVAGMVLGTLGLGFVFVYLMLASVMLPSLNRARETANRVECANHMQAIGVALSKYASANNNVYPRDFKTLIRLNLLTPVDLECPSTNLASGNTPFVLAASAPMAASAVIVYEPVSDHGDGANMLFGDGAVKFIKGADRAQKMIDDIKKASIPRGRDLRMRDYTGS